MSFWSAWWRRRAAGAPDTARPAHGRADGGDRSGKAGRQAAAIPEAVQDAATPQDGIAVELRGLAMRFGAVEALRGLNARIPAGRITGLVGPDGAGKTTLLRLLAGLMEPAAAKALCLRRRIQFVEKPRRVRRPEAANRVKSFSAGACTWQKILLAE